MILCFSVRSLVTSPLSNIFLFYLFIFKILFREGEGREKKGEKHQCVVVSCMPPTGDLACNTGMCPGLALDWWLPFGLWDNAQPTEPHQSGPEIYFVIYKYGCTCFSVDTICLKNHFSLFHFESVFVFAA